MESYSDTMSRRKRASLGVCGRSVASLVLLGTASCAGGVDLVSRNGGVNGQSSIDGKGRCVSVLSGGVVKSVEVMKKGGSAEGV